MGDRQPTRRKATSIIRVVELDVICFSIGADAMGCLESEKEREFPAHIPWEEGGVGGEATTARIFSQRQDVGRGISGIAMAGSATASSLSDCKTFFRALTIAALDILLRSIR